MRWKIFIFTGISIKPTTDHHSTGLTTTEPTTQFPTTTHLTPGLTTESPTYTEEVLITTQNCANAYMDTFGCKENHIKSL